MFGLQKMTNNFIMDEAEWGRLARLQDQIVSNENYRQRQRQNYHKLLYKNQLQKMIQERKAQAKTLQQKDKMFYKELYKSANHHPEASPEHKKFDKMLKLSAKDNFNTGQEKKLRMKSQIEQQRYILSEKYKKLATQIEEQKEKSWLEKEGKKKLLAHYYDEQIQGVDSKKYLQKLQDHKFQQLAQELQLRKEQQRILHMNKIKYGYQQKPQTFNKIKDIYQQREDQKEYFLKKLQNSRVYQNPQDKIKQKKHLETIEVSHFNKNCFLEKQMRMKQFHHQELEFQHQKIQKIQQQLNQEQDKMKLKKQDERNLLKHQLEHQISQHQEGKHRVKRMSQNESKINQQLFNSNKKSLLPGLNKDYKDRKQEFIIDNFLSFPKGGSITLSHGK